MTEQEILNKIQNWAESQQNIRTVLLTSSRTNPNSPRDPLSDYDVVLSVVDPDPYTKNDKWLTFLGDILVRFKDQWEKDGQTIYTRLVIYKDGTKVDFTVQSAKVINQIVESGKLPDSLEIGYEVLIDKDNIASRLKKPSYIAHIPNKPTEKEYLDLVEEFYWESSYVAKNLWRDELFPMKLSFDSVMKLDLVNRMLVWQIEIAHDWKLKPGAHGRHLKKQMPPELWSQIEETFVGSSLEENWNALFKSVELFKQVSNNVADSLGFTFPDKLHNDVVEYLQSVRTLEH